MILSALHSWISDEIAKGTRHDSVIPDYVERAARWIERNHTLSYMETFASFTQAAGSRTKALPTNPKSVVMLRIVQSTGAYTYLNAVDPQNVTLTESTAPTGYWIDGVTQVYFDNTPDEALTMEWTTASYTTWPSDTSQEPWLAANAEELLMSQAIVLMAPRLREPKLLDLYSKARDEGLRTLLLADEELRGSNRSESMIYE